MGVLTEGTLGLSGISPRFPYRIISNVSGNRLLTRAAPMGGAALIRAATVRERFP